MSEPAATTSKKPRRFLPEPIETISRSSKHHQTHQTRNKHVHQADAGPRPSVLDYTSPAKDSHDLSHPKYGNAREENQPGIMSPDRLHTHSITTTQNRGDLQQYNSRRFTPQLMETVSHSFRPQGGPVGRDNQRWTQPTVAGDASDTPHSAETNSEVIQESRFSYSNLLRRQESRRHSFRVPDLPAIPSSGSEDNETINSRLSGSPSAIASDFQPDNRRPPKDDRENSLFDYIVPFPLHPSENQLKERALEAFPNEQVYQPVDHFAIDKEDEDSPYGEGSNVRHTRPELWINRRASSADLPSELENLRRSKEEAGMNRRHYLTTKGGRLSHMARRASRNVDRTANRDEKCGSARPITQLTPATSPPMLGGDLVFPQSLTPEATICEGTRTSVIDHNEIAILSFAGLWRGSPRSSTHDDRGGLWQGTCKPDKRSTCRSEIVVPGLMVPEHGDEQGAHEHRGTASQTEAPRRQSSHLAVLDRNAAPGNTGYTDQALSDDFVTQIYDYLSLGYPSIARYYDYELSKVSGLSVAALRADDSNMDAKGHVGVQIGAQDSTNRGAANKVCMRWTALRLYIEEWVRYHPQMFEAGCYHEEWGVRERKGSWAF
ncbi:hypothetical protein BDV19DRAFT_65403 [Aspergillus venezuelensis]